MFIYQRGHLQERISTIPYDVDPNAIFIELKVAEQLQQTGKASLTWSSAFGLNLCMAAMSFIVACLVERFTESPTRVGPSPLVFWKAALTSSIASGAP